MQPSELSAMVKRLIQMDSAGRHDDIRLEMVRCEASAVAAGRASRGDYPADIMRLGLTALQSSIDSIWNGYRQVVSEVRIPWTDELRSHVLTEVEEVLDVDIPYIENLARAAMANHGHGFHLFLTSRRANLLDHLAVQIDLFAIRYHPVGGSLLNQLSAPRYAGACAHWREVVAAIQGDSPSMVLAAREAILAAEAVAKIVSNSPSGTLGECIKQLKRAGRLSEVHSQGPQALWNVANTTSGLRHAGIGEPVLPPHIADYVVGLAEATIRLLLGIDMAAA